jgi:hypothetical protein
MVRTLLPMSIVCPDCGATSRDASVATLGRSGRLGRCAGCAHQRLVADSVLPYTGMPEVTAILSATALADAGPTAQRRTMPAPGGPQRFGRGGSVSPWPDLSTMLTVPSPPLAPQIIDAVASISPRARPDRASPAARHRARPRGGEARVRFLRAILALQLAAVAAVLLGRAEVVRAIPEAASLFRMIGLPVNLRGLVFAGLETRTELRDGAAVLIVDGRIESDSESAVTVPPLRFVLRDAAGAELYAWTVPPDAATLGPGESLPFHARMAQPPPGGNDVLVRFAHPSDG